MDLATVKIFSDKKLFMVDQAHNRRNDRFIVDQGTPAIPVNRTKHPVSVMVLGVVCSDSRKLPPIFIPAGLKVNTNAYLSLLETELLPWLKKTYPQGNYIFQQD
jgi:hypothetical protein